MPKRKRPRRRKRGSVTRRRRRLLHQDGGVFPLLALAMPAIIAASKAAALGGLGAAAGFGVKKGLEKI